MPIYEYECRECGLHFDKLQRFGEPGPEACPRGHKDIHRLLGQPAIIFKGSGFYITDHRRNGSNAASSSDRSRSAPKKEDEAKPATTKSDNRTS